ncbi:flagellin N-terminal helical domain-containing protein [Tepidibacter sp. Z1-5]|uniref:flagellin N-terminal helical domain-containing protein n=1 Tax=Tepidibacter sp. Z1-5 TaxID=3134138 RepID=UPI0030BD2329
MRINHNIPSMNAHRLLNVNNAAASKALEKLSSGKRINRAGDDAAGMAITEKMRAQINGLKTASRNSLDGVSLVQTAEGAMSEVHSMLQRMRELSVQAANGTAADSDRQAIQDEINQLTSEVNRIANGTEYNTRNILKGNEGPNSNTEVHRMSTGEPAQMIGEKNLRNTTDFPNFNLKSDQLSIWIDGEEKVVNLTQTDGSTDVNDFMELVNDALGDSAKAVLNKYGQIEITTASIGGRSEVKFTGNAATKIFGMEPATVTGTTDFNGGQDFGTTADGKKIKINGNEVTLNNVKGIGNGSGTGTADDISIDDAIDALQKDIDTVSELQGKIKVEKDSTGKKIVLTTVDLGTEAKLKLEAGAPDGLGVLGLTAADKQGAGTNKAMGKAENATNTAKGSFYFDAVPEVGSTIKIGDEIIEFFDSSISPYVGSNRPIDINGKTTAEAVVEEIVNKFATGIDGVTLSEDPSFDLGASGTSTNARLNIVATKAGFDGNLIYLEGTPDDFTTNLQVGANTGQRFRLQIGNIGAKELKISADNPTRNPGVKGASYVKTGASVTNGISSSMTEYAVDVTSEEKASAAIKVFDNAIVQIASERSKLGATQNRLEHTIANLDNTNENLTAAMSRIEDTDMALEMANYQKLNVLQQAGVSMLAQANQQPQAILKLLG